MSLLYPFQFIFFKVRDEDYLYGHYRSLLFHSVIYSLGGLLSYGSPFVMFFNPGHPRFWNFYSTIPVDVVRVKSYMNCPFDPARVLISVTIIKLYFVQRDPVNYAILFRWRLLVVLTEILA